MPDAPLDVLEAADRIWAGRMSIEEYPFFDAGVGGGVVPVATQTGFVAAWSNVGAFDTDDGLVLVDTGSVHQADIVHGLIRSWTASPLHTAVYSHGHVDHVFGVRPFEAEDRRPAPRVVAHEGVPARFDRYRRTAGYQGLVNRRQFFPARAGTLRALPRATWPTNYRYPDLTYRDGWSFDVGGERFELHHADGETDDHTWTWVPGRRVIYCGDLFTWVAPNAGNPQKAQRYPKPWADALRQMASKGAEVVLPGHGLPLVGADRIREALTNSAAVLESIHDQTVELMNRGMRLGDIVHEVRGPADLLEKPYLRPLYDEPEFIVRNVWRQYGGWYDGNPANLKPPRDGEVAREVCELAGGVEGLRSRARELAAAGDLRLAGHLAEMAYLADPQSPESREARAEVFRRRAASEASLMARGIYVYAVLEARGVDLQGTGPSKLRRKLRRAARLIRRR
jgi:alkyl sulfatase BDS1-like metallo-beta-lactamase superfamily hydrolase